MPSQGRAEGAEWYVMRVYKNERKAEEMLSSAEGLSYYLPKQQAIRTRHGRKVLCWVPVIPSMVFVYATHQEIVNFKKKVYNDLQFITTNRGGNARYLIVPTAQMESFIRMCDQKQQTIAFYQPSDLHLDKGTKVRIHGGIFDEMEGTYLKMSGKRRKQFVVILLDIIAVSVEIQPEFVEIIE